jgi:hypothetical protein
MIVVYYKVESENETKTGSITTITNGSSNNNYYNTDDDYYEDSAAYRRYHKGNYSMVVSDVWLETTQQCLRTGINKRNRNQD